MRFDDLITLASHRQWTLILTYWKSTLPRPGWTQWCKNHLIVLLKQFSVNFSQFGANFLNLPNYLTDTEASLRGLPDEVHCRFGFTGTRN